jgi:hypothetical protein
MLVIYQLVFNNFIISERNMTRKTNQAPLPQKIENYRSTIKIILSMNKTFKIFLLVGVWLVNGCSAERVDLRKLSPQECVQALKLLDQLEGCSERETAEQCHEKDIQLHDLTDVSFGTSPSDTIEQTRAQLYTLMNQHLDHTSLYAKLIRVINFRNFLIILACFVGVAFLIAFTHDLVFALAQRFYQLIITHEIQYLVGSLLALGPTLIPYEAVKHTEYSYLWIFENYMCVFGVLIFSAIIMDVYRHIPSKHSKSTVFTFLTVFYGVTTVYHHQWFLGVMTIITLFARIGFVFGPIDHGYQTGFNTESALERCLILALVLVSGYLVIHEKAGIGGYIQLFETGILFHATLVELIAMLIISDDLYTLGFLSECNVLTRQGMMLIILMFNIYLGYILQYTQLKTLGGTFLVLWLMDVQRMIIFHMSHCYISLILFVIFANLMGLIYYIKYYPEYFIL